MATPLDIVVGELRVGFEQMHRDLIHAQVLLEEQTAQMTASMSRMSAATPAVSSMTDSFMGLGLSLIPLAGLFGTISAAVVKFGTEAVQITGQLEQSKVAMMTFTRSAEKADEVIKGLWDFALKTPFNIDGLAKATQQMVGFGFEIDKVPKMLRGLGDAVSATGAASEERMARIVKAFGEMNARGVLALKELNQLAMLGIPGLEMIAQQFGVSTERITQLTKTRAIESTKAIDALMQAFEQRFGGSMEMQSRTLLGQLSNMKEMVLRVLNEIGMAIEPHMKKLVEWGYALLRWVSETVKGFSQLSEPIKAGIVAFGLATVTLGPLVAALSAFALAIAVIGAPIAAAIATFAAFSASVIALGAVIVTAWPGIKAVFEAMRDDINSFVEALKGDWEMTGLKKFLDGIGAVASEVGKFIGGLVDVIGGFVSQVMSRLTAMLGLPKFFADIWKSISDVTSAFFDWMTRNWDVFVGVLTAALGPVATVTATVVRTVVDMIKNSSQALGTFGKALADSFLSVIPGIGPVLAGMRQLSEVYGSTFEAAMKAANGGKTINQVWDEQLAKLKGLTTVTKDFSGALDGVGTKIKFTADMADKASNSFMAWVATTERQMEATRKGVSLQNEYSRSRVAAIQNEEAQTLRSVNAQIAIGELALQMEEARTGVFNELLADRIARAKEYVVAMDSAFKQRVANEAAVDFEKLSTNIGNAATSMKGLGSETDRMVNSGWKQMGMELSAVSTAVTRLGRDLKISLDLEDPLQKISRLWKDFNTIQESGQFTASKVREIYVATFLEATNQINKAAAAMHVFEDDIHTFFSVKLQAAVMNIEVAFLKTMDTLSEGNRKAVAEMIASGASIEKVFGKLWTNLKSAFTDIWKTAATEILSVFSDVITDIERMILGTFKDVMMGALQGVLKQFGLMDDAVQTLTKRVKTELIPALGGTASTIAFPQAAGEAGKGAVDAGKGASSAASGASSLLGTLNLITAGITAVFSGLQYFQGRRMEQDIGRIEVTSRAIQNILASFEKHIVLTGVSTEFAGARLSEVVAALSYIGEQINRVAEYTNSLENMTRDIILAKFDALIAALGGAVINVNSGGAGGAAVLDVHVVTFQQITELLQPMKDTQQEWLPRIADTITQQVGMLSQNQRRDNDRIVGTLENGFKSVINAILQRNPISATNANPLTVNGDVNLNNEEVVGQRILDRMGTLGL